MTRLAALRVGGVADPWVSCGFACDGDRRVALANGALEFTEAPTAGLCGLVVDGVDELPDSVDGVPLVAGSSVAGVDHPNGAFELDHVVVMTDSIDRTSAAVADVLGLECRRVRTTDTVRQAFHRFDDQGGVRGCIIEVVESERATQPGLWGLVVSVVDLDAAVELLGPDRVGRPKAAVQPGRRIAPVRGAAGLGVPVALMSPNP